MSDLFEPDLKNFNQEVPLQRGFFLLLRFAGILAFSSLLLLVSILTYDYLKTRRSFPLRTYVGNVEVSYLTPQQASAKIKRLSLEELFAPLITLESDRAFFSFKPAELGLYVLTDKSVNKAFVQCSQKNYLELLREKILSQDMHFPLMFSLNKEKLRDQLLLLAGVIATEKENAQIDFTEETGGFHIEPEELGRNLNLKASLNTIEAGLKQGGKTFELTIDYDYPKIKEADLRDNPPVYRLAAYTTYYGSHDSANRIHNIKLVASWVDNTLLMPGDQFSVVDVLGDVTAERGFKEAYVIVGGELAPLLGGGSCQVATTLFNAVSLADLKILERRNHSFYFAIYPLGRDAGVYPGAVDFRFENDTPYPVLIKSVVNNKKLSFRIYGTPSGKKVTFSAAKVYELKEKEYLPASLKSVIQSDLPFKTLVERKVYDSAGKEVKTEKIASYYKLYGDKDNVPIREPEPR